MNANQSKFVRITIAILAVLVVLCIVLYFIFGSFSPFGKAQPTPLTEVPTYDYSTPTSTASVVTTATSTPDILTPVETPVTTATAVSFFIWPTYNTPQPGYSYYYATPTPYPTVVPPPVPEICRNILYPVKTGQEWNYFVNTNNRSGTVNMKIVTVEGSRGTVEVINSSKGLNGRTYVMCDQDVILNFPAMDAELLFGSVVDGTINASYISGVLAPNEAAFVSNNWGLAWSSQYLVSGSGTVNYNGVKNISLDPSNMTMTCQTLGYGEAAFDTVTVPAGTFRTLKVVCVGQGQATGTVNGINIVGWIRAQSTQWFAPYIGLVKLQSDYVNLEAYGVTIPLNASNLSGKVELQSFIQAP